jgi:ABC-type transport system substrate-binding protein
VEGFSIPNKRADRVVLEANLNYWDTTRYPRLKRIIFDNTLEQQDAVDLVKTTEGRVDVVNALRPLDTLRVAQSPFAKVVKARGSLTSVFGIFNIQKTGSPWRDVRLRQAVNYAINRADLIRYATKGNGVIIPALLPPGFGYDANLSPYPFAPDTTRQLLRETGHPHGLAITLIATKVLEVQATVVSNMLEQGGFQVTRQILDPDALNRQTDLSHLEQPPEQQAWDIALVSQGDRTGFFPLYFFYEKHALGGYRDWVHEEPALRQLYTAVLRTIDQERQQALIRQMERHTRDQAYFLFLYSPIDLYAVNKAVKFVPYVNGTLDFDETSITTEHWSVRKQKATVHE